MSSKVKGIKFGTLAQYRGLASHDPDTLYFITDKGCIYRGESIVIPKDYMTVQEQGSGDQIYYRFRLETFGLNGETSHIDNFVVYSMSAVNSLIGVVNTALAAHAAALATATRLGHVKLSDDTDDTTHDADYGENHEDAYAATPAAVAAALEAAKEYTDTQIAGLSSGMTIIGTYGIAADSPDESNPLDEIEASVGDTYICISTITNAAYHDGSGQATHIDLNPGDYIICVAAATVSQGTVTVAPCWTIVPNQSANAVTTDESALTADRVILGAGGKKVKTMAAGQQGQMMRRGAPAPEWFTHTLLQHGIAYGGCNDAENDPKTVTIRDYELQEGSLVAVRFNWPVAASDTLNVSGTGNLPIFYRGDRITAGVIEKGDTALFMKATTGSGNFTINAWVLLAVDRALGLPSGLSAFQNDIQGIGTCTTAYGNTNKTASIPNVAIAKGSVFAVRFANAVDAGSTLSVNSGTRMSILHGNAAITEGQILAGDTATFISDGTAYHLLSVDRKTDTTPTSGSNHLVTSNGIYQAIQSAIAEAALWWDEIGG